MLVYFMLGTYEAHYIRFFLSLVKHFLLKLNYLHTDIEYMQSDSLKAKATKLTLSTSLLLRPDQISFKPSRLLLLNFFMKSKLHTYRCVRVCAV